MSRSNLESLPTDVLLALIDQLDLPTKALLACCSKTLRHAIGSNVFCQLHKDRESRRKFFLQLEKDLPTDQFFCPGCDLFHNISNVLTRNNAPCVKADWRNEINEYYGADFLFYQARFALRLYQRQDTRSSQYLKGLESVEQQDWQRREFWNRDLRIVTIFPDYPPQMFLRLQHWRLMSHKDVRNKEFDDFHFSTVQICHHQIDPDLSESFSGLSPFQLGLCMIRNKIRRMKQDPVPGWEHHEHTQLHHCLSCGADYRMDILCIPEASSYPRRLFSRGISPHWAIVVTKWLDLGRLDTQDGEWQAHAYVERGRGFRYTVNRLTPGSAIHVFEEDKIIGEEMGGLNYKPCWSKDLERKSNKACE